MNDNKDKLVDSLKKFGQIILVRGFKIFGKVMFNKGLFFGVKEYHKDRIKPNTTYILCPNHTGDFDGPVHWSLHQNIKIGAKQECFANPLQAALLRQFGVVVSNRGGDNRKELRAFEDHLKDSNSNKASLCLEFNQGTISDINKITEENADDEIRGFGAYKIAADTGVPLVPMFMEQVRVFRSRKFRLVYGEPYYIEKKDLYVDVTDANHNSKNRIDRIKLLKCKRQWLEKVKELQEEALTLDNNRPFLPLKLKDKHRIELRDQLPEKLKKKYLPRKRYS